MPTTYNRHSINNSTNSILFSQQLTMAYKRYKSNGAEGRVFECKTCSKKFSSFQALGGHRTSHMRMGVASVTMKSERLKKMHNCAVCGLEFSMGQALGGHMTRHRHREFGRKKGEGTAAATVAVAMFDLNLPPILPIDQFFWDVPMIQFL